MKVKLKPINLNGIQPILDGWHIHWIRFWASRKHYSIYGPTHLDYAIRLANIKLRNRNTRK